MSIYVTKISDSNEFCAKLCNVGSTLA